jgi:uncharacterized repeat protein (TIGR01451 family)
MQYLNIRKVHRLMMALALFAGGSQTALAVGTPSGDLISNTATVDYQVGASARSASGSAPDIAVDNRVDVTVANQDGGNVNVSPGQTNRIQTYLVTNTGNTTQGYILTTAVPTAGIPMNNIRIYVDANTDGVPDAGELYTAGDNAGDLNPNGTIGVDDVMQVLVVADVPAGATNGAIDDFRLIAQTTNAGTNTVTTASGAPDPDPAVVDTVFADGAGTTSEAANDGQHSDAANYTVTSASLALAKTVLSTTDEFGTDFAIPGASIEYQLRVTNSGTGSVDNNTVVVTDVIPANTKVCVAGACGGVPVFVDGGTSSGLTAATFQYSTVAAPNECAPASFTGYSPTADADGADAAVTCIRQAPTGAMNGSGGFFDVRFFVVIE